MSIKLDKKEYNELLMCVDIRLSFISQKINFLIKLREKAITGEIYDDSFDKKIKSLKEEYSLLDSLRDKILKGNKNKKRNRLKYGKRICNKKW